MTLFSSSLTKGRSVETCKWMSGSQRTLSPSTCFPILVGSLRRDPLRVPIKAALVAVDEVTRFLEAVKLAGIDYEFGGNVEAAQGLIHLFAVEQRDIEIVPAAQK